MVASGKKPSGKCHFSGSRASSGPDTRPDPTDQTPGLENGSGPPQLREIWGLLGADVPKTWALLGTLGVWKDVDVAQFFFQVGWKEQQAMLGSWLPVLASLVGFLFGFTSDFWLPVLASAISGPPSRMFLWLEMGMSFSTPSPEMRRKVPLGFPLNQPQEGIRTLDRNPCPRHGTGDRLTTTQGHRRPSRTAAFRQSLSAALAGSTRRRGSAGWGVFRSGEHEPRP